MRRAPEERLRVPANIDCEWVASFHKALKEVTERGSELHLKKLIGEDFLRNFLSSAKAVFEKEPTLVQIEPRAGASVHVVGDTHGQFHDVLHMLSLTGYPSACNYFVFNGDYVDRGAWGVELVLALVALKLALPDNVFVLRGNHECSMCTKFYGFQKEIQTKFPIADGYSAQAITNKFLDVFKNLPLAALILPGTLIVHGGLWRKPAVVLKRGRGLGEKRKRKTSQDAAPVDAVEPGSLDDLRSSGKGGKTPQGYLKSSLVASDALWSDPVKEPGMRGNSIRQVGLVFGPDITERFCRDNNVKLIVRSHEGPDARYGRDDMLPMDTGHTVDHDTPAGRLVTVFSAPDYPQFQEEPPEDRYNNTASVLTLLAPSYTTYDVINYSAAPRPAATCFYDMTLPASDDELPTDGDEGGSASKDAAELGGTEAVKSGPQPGATLGEMDGEVRAEGADGVALPSCASDPCSGDAASRQVASQGGTDCGASAAQGSAQSNGHGNGGTPLIAPPLQPLLSAALASSSRPIAIVEVSDVVSCAPDKRECVPMSDNGSEQAAVPACCPQGHLPLSS